MDDERLRRNRHGRYRKERQRQTRATEEGQAYPEGEAAAEKGQEKTVAPDLKKHPTSPCTVRRAAAYDGNVGLEKNKANVMWDNLPGWAKVVLVILGCAIFPYICAAIIMIVFTTPVGLVLAAVNRGADCVKYLAPALRARTRYLTGYREPHNQTAFACTAPGTGQHRDWA